MSTPQSTHVQGFWPLWEESGVVAYDQTGNEQNGALANVVVGEPGLGDGRTSMLFDGVQSNIQLPAALLTTRFNGARGSIDGWIKVRDAGVLTDAQSRRAFQIRANSQNSVHIRKTSTANQFSFEYLAGNVQETITFLSTSTDWFHVCMTWDKAADLVIAYVNGVEVGRSSSLGTWTTTTPLGSCFIGAQTGGVAPTFVWSGWSERWRLWDVALTPAEAAQAAELPEPELRSRILTGRTFIATNVPWPAGTHTARLLKLGYIAQGSFPTVDVVTQSGTDGRWSMRLWCNADSLSTCEYELFYPDGSNERFTLPSGDTPISIEEVRGLQKAPSFTPPGIEAPIDAAREGILNALANPNDIELGDKMIGARPAGALGLPQTVHDALFRTHDIADHGAIAAFVLDSPVAGATADIAPAIRECLSIAQPGDTIVIRGSSDGLAYAWLSTVVWDKQVHLTIRGKIAAGTAQLIRANVSDVTIDARGGTVKHVPAAGQQSTGGLWYRKDTLAGDVALSCRNWTVIAGAWRNVTLRMSKIGRQGVRIPLVYDKLETAMVAGDTVLHMIAVPPLLTTAMQARVLLTNGTVESRQITAIDATARTITVSSPYSAGAPIGRRVTGYTLTTAILTAGNTVIPVALADTTNLFPVGMYATIALTPTRSHVSQIVSRTTNSITIQNGIPAGVTVPSGALVSGLNTGITPNGTDLEACTLRDVDLGHIRSNYAVEVGGGAATLIDHCYVHDVVRWKDANSANYWQEIPPSAAPPDPVDVFQSLWDVNFGEALKITGATKSCVIRNTVLRRVVRNGVDAFNSGEVLIDGCTFEDSYYAAALEAKWSPTDVTPPVPIKFINCLVRNMPTYGVIAGVPGALVQGNTFENIGKAAVYLNGGHGSSLIVPGDDDDDGAEVGRTTGPRVLANRITNVAENGIIVSEVDGAVISNNEVTAWATGGAGYAIQLLPPSKTATVTNNRLIGPASGSTYIRMAGVAGVPSLHHFQDNETDGFGTELSIDVANPPSFYTHNGYGQESVSGSTQPTNANWRIGSKVANVDASKIWLRITGGWAALT